MVLVFIESACKFWAKTKVCAEMTWSAARIASSCIRMPE